MSKRELLKSIGFSDDFLDRIDRYNSTVIEIDPPYIPEDTNYNCPDVNNLIISSCGDSTNNVIINTKK